MGRKSKERESSRNQKLQFIGNHEHDAVVIGNYGNSSVEIEGNFNISGIIYAPKYSINLFVSGKGIVTFRGICSKLIINNMNGDCILDIRDLSCKEIAISAIKGKAKVITGKVRAILEANMKDEAALYTTENPLIFNALTSDNAKIAPFDETVEKTILCN